MEKLLRSQPFYRILLNSLISRLSFFCANHSTSVIRLATVPVTVTRHSNGREIGENALREERAQVRELSVSVRFTYLKFDRAIRNGTRVEGLNKLNSSHKFCTEPLRICRNVMELV